MFPNPLAILTRRRELYQKWGTFRPREVADQLVFKGWARNHGSGAYRAILYDAEAAATPDWIWLPNALVDGAGKNLAPPESNS